VQIDVVAINWREKQLLLGEAKWRSDPIRKGIVLDLINSKTVKLLKQLPAEGDGWQIHYAFFSRSGFTEEARSVAEQYDAQLVTLARLATDLLSGPAVAV